MSSGPLLLHVGYHKTGTTWLQRSLFRPHLGFLPLMSHEEVFRYVVRPHGLLFDPAEARKVMDQRLAGGPAGAAPVISSEILSGNPLFGGHESDAFARRLVGIAPEARILITIREQISMLVSVYMQYLLRGGTLTPEKFFSADPEIGYRTFAPEHFEYDRLIGLYGDLYGAENVLVVTQEALAEDPLATARAICAFCGNPAGITADSLNTRRTSPSAGEFCAPVLRRINHFRDGPAGPGAVVDLGALAEFAYRGVRRLGGARPVRSRFRSFRPVRRVVERRFGGFFVDSNRRLADLVGSRVDLSAYMR